MIFQISVYEAKLKKTQEENVQIQVENSTLQSQSTSLLSQINTLQNSNVTLEMAKKRVSFSYRAILCFLAKFTGPSFSWKSLFCNGRMRETSCYKTSQVSKSSMTTFKQNTNHSKKRKTFSVT